MDPEGSRLTDPGLVLALLPLADDRVVADIGCGPSYFAVPLALRLRRGKLYAFDVQEPMLEAARKTIATAALSNVEVQTCSEMELPLPDESLDCAFLAFSFHEVHGRLEDCAAMIRNRLKPGGSMAVIERKKEPVDEGPPLEDRLSESDVTSAAQAAGLMVTEVADLNEKQYFVLLTKPAG